MLHPYILNIISNIKPMKKNALIPVMLLVFFTSGCAVSSSQSSGDNISKKEQRAAEMEKVAALIESGNFIYTVQSISPSGSRTLQATTTYTMKAVNGNYEASLPYFGRAYQASYGGNGPIEFNGTPEDLKVTRNTKKNSLTVTFAIAGERDRYSVTFQVGYSGYGTLIVNSQNRQSISYYGMVSEISGT
jgi:hypothetical protein